MGAEVFGMRTVWTKRIVFDSVSYGISSLIFIHAIDRELQTYD